MNGLEKTHTFLVSDESLNSHWFKVLTKGIDTAQFERNPVMLYMHDRKSLVIGRWENIRVEGNELYADAVFDEEDPEALKIAGKVERGFIRAASIGITELEREGNTITRSELREISIVDIGSNKNALRLYDKGNRILNFNYNLNTMDLLSELINLLELPEESTEDDVMKAVTEWKERAEKAEGELNKLQNDQSNQLMDLAISTGVISSGEKANYQRLFKSDFRNTKLVVQNMLNKAPQGDSSALLHDFVMERVNGKAPRLNRQLNASGEAQTKLKSDWTLDDYRRHAPRELKEDKELYKTLIKREFGETE